MDCFPAVSPLPQSPIQEPGLLAQSPDDSVVCSLSLPHTFKAPSQVIPLHLLSIVKSFKQQILSSYYVLGTVLGIEYTLQKYAYAQSLLFWSSYF